MKNFFTLLEQALKNDLQACMQISSKFATNDGNNTSCFRIEDKELIARRILLTPPTNANEWCLRGMVFQYRLLSNGPSDFLLEAKKSYEAALQLENDHPCALFHLGYMYIKGEGVDNKDEKYIHYFQGASNLGHPAAMTYLADSLFQQGDPANLAAAISWLEKAIALNFPDALYLRAKIYINNQPDNRSYLEAAKLYRRGSMFGQNLYEASSGLKKILSMPNLADTLLFEINYHKAIFENKPSYYIPLIQSDADRFLTLLIEDDLLSESSKIEMLNIMVKEYPQEQQYVNLLGNYWIRKAKKYLQADQQLEAVWAFQNVPVASKYYGEALYAIAVHHYLFLQQCNNLDKAAAAEYARPYLELGVSLKDEVCTQLYETIVDSAASAQARLILIVSLFPIIIKETFDLIALEKQVFKKDYFSIYDNRNPHFFKSPPNMDELSSIAYKTATILQCYGQDNTDRCIEDFSGVIQLVKKKYFSKLGDTHALQGFSIYEKQLTKVISEFQNAQTLPNSLDDSSLLKRG